MNSNRKNQSRITFRPTSERWRSSLSSELPPGLLRLFSGPVFDDGKSLWHIDITRNTNVFLDVLINSLGERTLWWDRDYCAYDNHMDIMKHASDWPSAIAMAIPRMKQPIEISKTELMRLVPALLVAVKGGPTGFIIRVSRVLNVFLEDECVVYADPSIQEQVVATAGRHNMRCLPSSLIHRPTIPGVKNLLWNARQIKVDEMCDDDVTIEPDLSLFMPRTNHWI